MSGSVWGWVRANIGPGAVSPVLLLLVEGVGRLTSAAQLRQHLKTDTGGSVCDTCYGWREDSESLNSTLDRTLYGGRMIAYGAVRQLTMMLSRNAIAPYLHQRRQAPERAV